MSRSLDRQQLHSSKPPDMSTAGISHSPRSSPLGSGHHAHLSSTPRVARTSSPNAPAVTPRPVLSRHASRHPGDGPESSPNYFNLSIDQTKSCASSGGGIHARANWSPPSSRVRSTAAASPRIMAVDQNPEFAEFRRQSELRSSQNGAFNFNFTGSLGAAITSPVREPQPTTPASIKVTSPTRAVPGSLELYLHDEKPRSPKRTLSSSNVNITDRPRRNSPAGFTEREIQAAPQPLQHLRDDEVRFSLPGPTTSTTPPSTTARADTLPADIRTDVLADSSDGPPFVMPAHAVTLLNASGDDVLLLDLRVSTQYARARISGALNLCIPTTLLKRPSYNTKKLAETFTKSSQQKEKFEQWKTCKYIIVYDGSASKAKDAQTCVNMLKKFATEGWNGNSYIIRGGYHDFARQFPALIEHGTRSQSGSESPSSIGDSACHSLAPVIGGCPMPVTKDAMNPFFGNIRQNMDLIGGVGQISLKRPGSIKANQLDEFPTWLRIAFEQSNDGKLVSDKFLAIEKLEQKRMQEALSGRTGFGTPDSGNGSAIQIAGIEKGSKNRYNNIWPYEHSRVKLEGVVDGGCDYVNANYVKAPWSNKRYIATQGPIPATFIDFWSVVWQQDVRVVVMLTAEQESGQVKAHNYWNQKHYGPLHLTFLSEHRASLEPAKIHKYRERPSVNGRKSTNPTPFGQPTPLELPQSPKSPKSEQPYVIVRKFTLSNDDEPFERMREITQLQYSSWPDLGAPAHPAHVLGLVEQCDAVVHSTGGGSPVGPASVGSRPVLVHCSAGCGRTGTFCTVDSVLDMLKRQRAHRRSGLERQPTPMELDRTSSASSSDDDSMDLSADKPASPFARAGELNWIVRDDIDLIEKTVEEFRRQRLSMVQNLRQFVLCYETVLEWLGEQTVLSV